MAFQHFVMTISTNQALKEKLHAEYEAENERRAAEANKPEEEKAKWLEEQIYDLVKLCAGALSDNPLFFVINSYTAGLTPSVMKYVLSQTVAKNRNGELSADEIGIMVEKTGQCLPCGSTAIWMQK